jgi:hypothetical protein
MGEIMAVTEPIGDRGKSEEKKGDSGLLQVRFSRAGEWEKR